MDTFMLQPKKNLVPMEAKEVCQEAAPLYQKLMNLTDEMTSLFKLKGKCVKDRNPTKA